MQPKQRAHPLDSGSLVRLNNGIGNYFVVLTIRRPGSRVTVVCNIPPGDRGQSKASFQIDKGTTIVVAHDKSGPAQVQKDFWISGRLPLGSHLLTITNLNDDVSFLLDRIDFDTSESSVTAQTTTL